MSSPSGESTIADAAAVASIERLASAPSSALIRTGPAGGATSLQGRQAISSAVAATAPVAIDRETLRKMVRPAGLSTADGVSSRLRKGVFDHDTGLTDRLKPVPRVLHQTPRNEGVDRRGEGRRQCRQIGFAFRDGPQDFRGSGPAVERASREHLVEHDTESPDIRPADPRACPALVPVACRPRRRRSWIRLARADQADPSIASSARLLSPRRNRSA